MTSLRVRIHTDAALATQKGTSIANVMVIPPAAAHMRCFYSKLQVSTSWRLKEKSGEHRMIGIRPTTNAYIRLCARTCG